MTRENINHLFCLCWSFSWHLLVARKLRYCWCRLCFFASCDETIARIATPDVMHDAQCFANVSAIAWFVHANTFLSPSLLKAPTFCSLFNIDVNYLKARYCWKKCPTLRSTSPSCEECWLTTWSNYSSLVMTFLKPKCCNYVASTNINYQHSSFTSSSIVLTWWKKPFLGGSIALSSMPLGGIAHTPVSFVRTI